MSAAAEEFNQLVRDKEQRSRHPADDDDDDDLNLSEEDEVDGDAGPDEEDAPRASLSPSQARSTIPLTRYNANTGPKGVITDAQHFRDAKRQHRASARGSTAALASQVRNRLSVRERPVGEKTAESDEEIEDDEDGGDDDDFMRQWRRNRLRELQNGSQQPKVPGRGGSKPQWGGLAVVDGEGYLDAVDKSPADTVVVVYIYDDYSDVSAIIEDCVRTLARTYRDTRFVKLHYHDAQMESAGVPALLAYRGGEKFAGLVPIIQEIPDDADMSADTLDVVLQRHQILLR